MKPFRFIKAAFLCLTAITFTLSAKAQETKNVSVNNFSEVSVSVGIELHITQGNSESAKIIANADVIDDVIVEQSGNAVKVHWKQQNWNMKTKNRKAKVYLSYIKLNTLSATTGSSVFTENKLKTDHLDFSVTTGANIDILLAAENLDLHSSTGANLALKGTVGNLNIESSTGSNINALDLMAENAIVHATTGANIRINVKNTLETTTSTGGSISYKGNAVLKNNSKRISGTSKID